METPSQINNIDGPEGKKKYRIAVVDIEHHKEAAARDAAEASLTAAKENAGWFSKIWKHNLWREVYRQRELSAARNKITSENNLLAMEDGKGREAHQKETLAIAQRFASEYEEMVNKEAGETREVLTDSPEAEKFKAGLKALIKDYAEDKIKRDAFEAERTRLVAEVSHLQTEGDARAMHADNIFAIAEQVKAAVEHKAGLEALDFDLEITLGRARSSIRTEAQFNSFDKVAEKIKNSRGGYFANETTVTSALAIAYSVGAMASRSFANSRLAAWGTFGLTAVLGGGIAAAKEAVRIKEERRQHQREKAKGKDFDLERSPRRQEMEKYRYDMKSATELTEDLQRALYDEKDGEDVLKEDMTQEQFEEALRKLTEIEARIQLSLERNIDLISYSDVKVIEQERNRLDEARIKAKVALGKLLHGERTIKENGPEFNYAIDGLVTSEEIKDFLATEEYQNETDQKKKEDLIAFWLSEKRLEKNFVVPDIDAAHGAFTDSAAAEYAKWDHARMEEILRADSASKKTSEKKVPSSLKVPGNKSLQDFIGDLAGAKEEMLKGESGIEHKDEIFRKMRNSRAMKAAVMGMVTGLVVGGVAKEGMAFLRDDETGLIEHFVKGGSEKAGALQHFTAPETLRRWMAGTLPKTDIGIEHHSLAGQDFLVPRGTTIAPGPGFHSFRLIDASDHHIIADKIPLDQYGHVTPEGIEMLRAHGVETHVDWKAIAGNQDGAKGIGGSVVHEKGVHGILEQFKDRVQHIKRDFWYEQNTPKPVFDQNELKLDIRSDGHGHHYFDMHRMRPDGSYEKNFSVDAQKAMKAGQLKVLISLSRETQGTPIMLPVDVHGNAIVPPDMEKVLFDAHGNFLGKFGEVGQSMGFKNGFEHYRLLATEVGRRGMHDTPPGPLPFHSPGIHPITRLDTPHDYRIDPPPVTPLFGRSPLEPERKNPVYPNITPEKADELRKHISPRLLKNPEAALDVKKETEWYFKDQEERYPGYVKELQKLSEQVKEPMGESVEAVVALAVAGHQEHDNIYRTLETYAAQRTREGKSVWDGDRSRYEILLYVNYPAGANPEKSLAEIARFKKDHPEVVVRTYQEEITNGKKELGWYKKKVFDLVLERNRHRKNMKDVAVIMNDADMTHTSRAYLEDVTNFMGNSANRSVDALLGRQDLDPEVYAKNPTFHVLMRFWHFMESLIRAKQGKIGTQGRNTVMRSSAYAAIGGNRTKDFWADIEFGEILKVARNGKNTVSFMNRAWVMVDPRREIDKFKSGEKIADTWEDFNERENVRSGQKAKHAVPENFDVKAMAEASETNMNVQEFERFIEEQMQAIVNFAGSGLDYSAKGAASSAEIVRRAAEFTGIGVDLSKENGKLRLKVKNTATVRRRLAEYAETGRSGVKIAA